MRLSFDEGRRQSSTSELIDLGRELIRQSKLTNRRDDRVNRTLAMIAKFCLVEDGGAAIVREVCRNLREAILKAETRAFYHSDLLQFSPLARNLLQFLKPSAGIMQSTCSSGSAFLTRRVSCEAGRLIGFRKLTFSLGAISSLKLATLLSRAGLRLSEATGETGLPQWTSTAENCWNRLTLRKS